MFADGTRVALTQRPLRVLECLLDNCSRAVSADEILKIAWDGVEVDSGKVPTP